jgi:hypothetical protein
MFNFKCRYGKPSDCYNSNCATAAAISSCSSCVYTQPESCGWCTSTGATTDVFVVLLDEATLFSIVVQVCVWWVHPVAPALFLAFATLAGWDL